MTDFSQHFTYGKLIKHSISPIIMMVFTSIYGVIDGLFLSNFAGKTAFAAVNFILPYLMLFGGIGFMFGTGGSALIAKTLGEGRNKKANEIFSSMFVASLICGISFTIIGQLLLKPVSIALGAENQLLEDCLIYGRIYLLGVPACIIQYEFQNLYTTAGKANLGLYATIASGVSNIILDAIFVAGFSWGLRGAAFATIISQWVGGIIPMIYFGIKNSSMLRFVKAKFDFESLFKICSNGFSEVVNNISISIVGMLYNVQLLKYGGDDGIAVYGILMYVGFLFTAIFWGYIVGVSPLISYQYGAENTTELKSLVRKSLVIMGATSAVMFLSAEIFAKPISEMFVSYDEHLMDMTLRGFFIFSFNFLFAGYSIFGSSFFTALNNGIISALISFLRTFVLQIAAILILPLIWGLDGVWISLVVSEFLTTLVSFIFIIACQKKYQY